MNQTKNKILSSWMLYFAWLVSILATMGSLYFSEIKGYVPCDLCWYQRIFMYPLIFILGIGTFFKDSNVRRYIYPLAVIGASISLYHYLHQKVPGLMEIKSCRYGVYCNMEYINVWGFITIPFLAFTAFVTIIVLLTISSKPNRSEKII
jgi:disulfide bond formation protein DsbB